jgi:hypothetical protein
MQNINKSNLKNFTFSEFSKLINQTDTLIFFKNQLKDQFNPKIVLLAYTIHQFSNELFYKSDELLELLIKYKGEKLIDLFETNPDSNEFLIEYNDFNDHFNEWKHLDAIKLKDFFNNSLKDLDIYKNMDFTDDIKTQINSKQEFIRRRKQFIINKYQLNLQSNENDTENDTENNTENELENIIEKTFWDLFRESLVRFESRTLNEQDIQWIVNLLIEIRDSINHLTPNNQVFINETNEYFDIKFIEQRIRNNCLDPAYLNQLLFFIMDRILLLQAAVDDISTKRWIYLTKRLLEYDCHYYDLLPIYFKTVYKKLKRINIQLTEYHETTSK